MNFTTQLRYSSSHKHDALYFYFSRLVQPIWEKSLCRLNGLTVKYIYIYISLLFGVSAGDRYNFRRNDMVSKENKGAIRRDG